MSALATLPGLSALLAWPTEHLTEAAEHWEAVAGRSYGVANQVWRDSNSVGWHGSAADRLLSATHADMLTTSAVADQLHGAAKVARSGASDLYAARSRVRYAVDDARAAGFNVGEDISVTERSSGVSPAQLAARRAEAQAFASDIRHRATQLVGLDQQVADRITAAVAGIRQTFAQGPASDSPSKDNHVRAVDNHSFKQDPSLPTPGPPGNPFAGWTDEQMAQVATEIAHGHAWREHSGDFPWGWTERDLARWIYDTMKDPEVRTATSIKTGGTALLRDGTVIYIDPRNPDYGTAFKPEPEPASTWRTPLQYFEQQTRALEPLPPPTPQRLPPLTPSEMAPPVSPSPPAPRPAVLPAEPPPAARPTPPPTGIGGGASTGIGGGGGIPGPGIGGLHVPTEEMD